MAAPVRAVNRAAGVIHGFLPVSCQHGGKRGESDHVPMGGLSWRAGVS
jgi:hypothetical protein